MKKSAALFLMLCILFLYGCPPKPVQTGIPSQPSGPTQPQAREDGVRRPGGISEEDLAKESERRAKAGSALTRAEILKTAPFVDIRFDFDSYTIRQEYTSDVMAIAEWLKKHRDIKVTIEGHTDERGTTEYNFVLGQKRAESARDFLLKLGVQQDQLRAVSYGKEMPADPGHSEEAWSKNRRVHFSANGKG